MPTDESPQSGFSITQHFDTDPGNAIAARQQEADDLLTENLRLAEEAIEKELHSIVPLPLPLPAEEFAALIRLAGELCCVYGVPKSVLGTCDDRAGYGMQLIDALLKGSLNGKQ